MYDRGFTIIEVVVALALFAIAALSIAQLFVVTSEGMRVARLQTDTVSLAAARMEQLRSLAWTFDSVGNPVSDLSTNLSTAPPRSDGGGLRLSPPGALEQNTAGFVDFLDARGRWISSGPAPPPAAVYVRRWSIEMPPDGAADSLVLQVLVRPVGEDAMAGGRRPLRARGEARLLSLRTRMVP